MKLKIATREKLNALVLFLVAAFFITFFFYSDFPRLRSHYRGDTDCITAPRLQVVCEGEPMYHKYTLLPSFLDNPYLSIFKLVLGLIFLLSFTFLVWDRLKNKDRYQ